MMISKHESKFKEYVQKGCMIFVLFISVFFIFKYFVQFKFFCHLQHFFGCGQEPKPLDSTETANLFIGLSALFTFIAFGSQYWANKQQNRIHEEQSLRYSEEKAQNFFFNLLNICRSNTEIIKINDQVNGKRAFHFMFYEFTCIHKVLRDELLKEEKESLNTKEIFTLAYAVFINGVFKLKTSNENILEQNKVTSNICKAKGISKNIAYKLLERLYYMQQNSGLKSIVYKYFLFDQYACCKDLLFFDGHRQWLSFSVKHLAQTINFIINERNLGEQKKSYFQLLSSQMSDHELFVFILHSTYLYYMESESDILKSHALNEGEKFKEGLDIMLEMMETSMKSKLKDLEIVSIDKEGKYILSWSR